MRNPRVKICCISSLDEAQLAIDAGASALGLVGPMPSGPGVIDNALIAEIARMVPPPIATFLLTSETRAADVIERHRLVQTSTIQLVDALPLEDYGVLRKALPQVKLVQVIHVLDEGSVEEAQSVAPHVDAILLDSGNPNLDVKVLGGTGKTHNWALSRRIRAEIPVPVFLAGGLRAENAREAIESVGPFGLDLCSGVRTDGALDPQKLQEFFKAVNT
ncbi:phosphoribosylanthranilate isomerase [Cryomorphaceae bacterium]|nr:phosphoribosylanthranilate isomerase [Cryomorphaceae bacterium]